LEVVAAVNTFERLKTAKAICDSILGESADQFTLVAVFTALCAETRKGQGKKPRP
jgi:hypothetical protein